MVTFKTKDGKKIQFTKNELRALELVIVGGKTTRELSQKLFVAAASAAPKTATIGRKNLAVFLIERRKEREVENREREAQRIIRVAKEQARKNAKSQLEEQARNVEGQKT